MGHAGCLLDFNQFVIALLVEEEVVFAAVLEDSSLRVGQALVGEDVLEHLALPVARNIVGVGGCDILELLVSLDRPLAAQPGILPGLDRIEAVVGSGIGVEFLKTGVEREGAVPGGRAAGHVLEHIRAGRARRSRTESAQPAELDAGEIPDPRGGRRAGHQPAEILHSLRCGDDVVGVAPADHVPTEMGVVGGFTDRRRRLQKPEHPVLRSRHVVPVRLVNVLGAVEIDHLVGARPTVDVGDLPGDFILDVGVLVEADERRPGVDVEQARAIARPVRGGRGPQASPAAAGELERLVGAIGLVFDQLLAQFQNPATVVERGAGGVLADGERGGAGGGVRGQRVAGDRVQAIVRDRSDVGIALAGF